MQNSWRQDGVTNGSYKCVYPTDYVSQTTILPSRPCTGPGGNPGVGDIFVELIGGTRFNFGDGSPTVGSPGPANNQQPLMYKVTSADPVNNWVFAQALDPTSLPNVDTTIQHTYTSNTVRTASIDDCCRISPCTSPNAHMNNPDGNYTVQTVVTPGVADSSPVSSMPPIILCPQNGVCTFQITASDNEGDALTYRLANSSESSLTSQPGPPECPNAATVSPSGAFTWNTAGCRVAGDPLPQPPNGGCNNSALNTLYSTQVIVEETGKQVRIALDFFIQLVNPCQIANVAPSFQSPSPCGSTFSAGPGTPLSFTVKAADADSGDAATLNAVSLPAGASMVPMLPTSGNPVTSNFSWTPTLAQVGQYVMTFTATDRCNAQSLCTVTVDVSQENCNDGIDNDGDGQIDCADQDCAGVACDDGQFCTVGDTCQNHVCTGGPARDCSDGNACTTDSCNETTNQCDHAPLTGSPCEDGSFCTVNDVCQAGTCTPGPARDCSDGNDCTADTCNEATDHCDHDTAPLENASCDDGAFCTVNDTCHSGICSGSTRDCNDHNDCTVDSCNENTDQCVNNPAPLNGTACYDGAFCTVNDTCQSGSCSGTARICNDNNACTADSCNEATDQCDFNPTPLNGSTCDDGAFCTVNDKCQGGTCSGTQRDCADTNPCTIDSCDESGNQCAHNAAAANGNACDDGAFCTVNDTCHSGTCSGTARTCDDNNDCTADSCNEATDQCDFDPVPRNGTGCNDGLFCTVSDTCQGGTCTGTQRDCTDTNQCTTDSCDEAGNQCVHDAAASNGNPCDDGAFCTVNDTCQAGACNGTTRDCTDNNPCTADSCNENTDQCVHNPNPLNDTPCDDGLYCTTDDTCTAGSCTGAQRDCSDGNQCTVDSCNEGAHRCDHNATPLESTTCDDGFFCTINDTCQSGTCTSGGPRNCADTSPCTQDSCSEATKQCVNDPAPFNGTPCNDGTACTQNDRCTNGTCTGTPLVCDDGNACNGVETCSSTSGCVPGTPLACDDHDVCNGVETCNPATGCVLGTALNCDDGTDCSVDRCDPIAGCSHSRMPALGCLQPGKSLLLMRDKTDSRRDKLVWKWGKGTTTSLDLGNPRAGGTKYTLCIYDQSDGAGSGRLRSSITIPPGGVCQDGADCWKQVGGPPKKFRYKNQTPASFKKLLVKASTASSLGGLAGNARVVMVIRGDETPLPSPLQGMLVDQSDHVLVQLVNSTGQCWEGKYLTPALRNRLDSFKDKCFRNGQGVCE